MIACAALALHSGVAWANTANVGVTVSNGTQGVANSVTVSGSSQLGRDLFVYVAEGFTGCEGTPSSELGDGVTTLSSGTAIGPGSFSQTYSYTPPDPNVSYEVCAYVDDVSWDTPDAEGQGSFSTSLPAASVSVAAANGTQGVANSVTVSGSSQLGRDLFVYVAEGFTGCEGTPSSELGDGVTTLSSGTAIGPGSFSQTYSYTPPDPNVSYEVCAYVDDVSWDTPDAASSTAFTTGMPAAGVAISHGVSIQGVATSITVSGSSQLARDLYVYLVASGTACGGTPSSELDDEVTTLSSGTAIGPGSFSQTYSYTPPDANVSYEVCAYVDDVSWDTPDAASSTNIAVAVPPATVALSTPSTIQAGVSTQITASGTTDVPETLSLRLCNAGGCSRLTPSGGIAVGAGAFQKTLTLAPEAFGISTVTATVTDPAGGYVSATSSSSFNVPSGVLVGPANGGSGPQFNPRFTWTGPAGDRYALVVGQRVRNKIEGLVQLQANGFTDLPSSSVSSATGLASGGLRSLSGVASFAMAATKGSAALKSPLPPGHYLWRLITSAPAGAAAYTTSPWRSFTVLGPRLRHLSVHATAHPAPSFNAPGYTSLNINATEYSTVRISYTHAHHSGTRTLFLGASNLAQLRLNWSCARAGGSIRYTVTAYDQEGDHRSAVGTTGVVSTNACATLHAELVAAQRARALARERAAAAAQRRAEEQQHQAYERFVHNCEALGGTPVDLNVGGEIETFCRAPYGGYLNVPY